MDYIEFCKAFCVATGIPVTLLDGRKAIYSTGGELLTLEPSGILDTDLVPWSGNPAFCRHSADIEYGRVQVEKTTLSIILGPMFDTPVTEQVVRAYIADTSLPTERCDDIREFLHSIPRITHSRFAWNLSLIHMCVNGKPADLDQLYASSSYGINVLLDKSMAQQDPLTDNPEQNTYRQESILFQLIKLGDLPSLEKRLKSAQFPMVFGTYATTPLRQAKNLFIVTVTKAGILGAIPGGGDVEKVYQLISMYIRECEQLQNIDAVYALMFSMLQDFCRITGEAKLPEELSADVYAGVHFIRAHTNESIGVEDVARHIGRSESYLASHFRQELGTSVGAYITECKLEKARSLLRHSDRTLAEISAYLCFSSQSYFQNVFKKQFGVTPTQYRRKHRAL